MKIAPFFLCVASLFLLSSCVKYNTLLNYQEAPTIPTEPQVIANYQPIIIQPNDILHIRVSSTEDVSVQPFTLSGMNMTNNSNNAQNSLLNGFLVSQDGTVDFPTLGKINLSGLTIEQAKLKITELLDPYFEENPIINMRLLNFRISVNGEVNSPGSFTVPNERVTIIEAVTMAGDFTSFSRRDSVLIVREGAGVRSFGYVDFNSAEVFTSPYFYLQQNDMVYIRPQKTKVGTVRDPATRVLPWVTAVVSVTAFLVSVLR